MRKSIKLLSLVATLGLGVFLAACSQSGSNKATTAQGGDPTLPPLIDTSTSVATTLVEVTDCPVETGTYMKNTDLYDYNKSTKKLIITSYADYDAYKSNNGTKKLETTVKFVDYNGYNAIYYKNGDTDNYIYLNESNKIRIKEQSGISYTELGLISTENIIEPAYGTYVSEAKERTKTDSQGQPVSNGDGGYEKETFYVFFVLTATSAKIYISDNNTTHGDTVYHEKNDYKFILSNGYVQVKIPHTDDSYDTMVYAKSDTIVHYTLNSGGRYDYGSSGNMTKIA